MPVGGLLVLVSGIKNACFIKVVANNLQTDGFVIYHTAGDRHAGQACQVGGDGIDIFQVHSHWIITFGAKFKGW